MADTEISALSDGGLVGDTDLFVVSRSSAGRRISGSRFVRTDLAGDSVISGDALLDAGAVLRAGGARLASGDGGTVNKLFAGSTSLLFRNTGDTATLLTMTPSAISTPLSFAATGAITENGYQVWNANNLIIGTHVQAYDADLAALASVATDGFLVRTGTGTAAARSITGTAAEITVSNGDGVAGAPTLSLPAAITLTGKTLTGGTFASPAVTGSLALGSGVKLKGGGGNILSGDGTTNTIFARGAGGLSFRNEQDDTTLANLANNGDLNVLGNITQNNVQVALKSGTTFTGQVVLSSTSLKGNSGATAAEAYVLASRVGVGIPVPYLTPATNNSVIAFDMFPKGVVTDFSPNTGAVWFDMVDSDISAGGTNYECLRLGKLVNGSVHVGAAKGGTGTVRGLLLQMNGGDTTIGASSAPGVTTNNGSFISTDYFDIKGGTSFAALTDRGRLGYSAANGLIIYGAGSARDFTFANKSGSSVAYALTGTIIMTFPGGIDLGVSSAGLKFNGTQVIGARRTGWTAPTGTATRTGFATSTATTTQLAETLKALIDDLVAHGVIGS